MGEAVVAPGEEFLRRLLAAERRAARAEEWRRLAALTNAPRARVFHSANQTIAHNTVTASAFDSERYDSHSLHDPGNNTRLVAVRAGLYHIFGHVSFLGNVNGERQVRIRVNGTDLVAAQTQPVSSAANTRMTVATEIELAEDDYVQLEVFQTSGGDLTLSAGAKFSPEFGMRWVDGPVPVP